MLSVRPSRAGPGYACGSSQRGRLDCHGSYCGAIDLCSLLPVSGASSFSSLVCKKSGTAAAWCPDRLHLFDFPPFRCVINYMFQMVAVCFPVSVLVQLRCSLHLRWRWRFQARQQGSLFPFSCAFSFVSGILSYRTLRSALLLLEHFPSSHLTDLQN